MRTQDIAGYTYGSVPASPLTGHDLDLLKASVLFSEEDERYLRMAGDVLEPQVDDVLDLWYGFVGSHPHLLHYFTGPDGQPIPEYLAAVRKRFGQWILDTCRRPYDQTWMDYQNEIGLRHHRSGKNKTDHVASAPNVSARYLVAFVYPITATIKDFLAKGGHSAEEVEKMHQAWFKAVVLQVTLWLYPYVNDGDF